MIHWSSGTDLLSEKRVTGGLRLATFPGAQISVPYRVLRAVRRDWQRRTAGSCLNELRPVLYLTAEQAPEILGAQAEWRAWLLRGPSARWLPRAMEATAQRRRGLPSRSAWCPVRDPARALPAAAVTEVGWRIDRARGGALFTTV